MLRWMMGGSQFPRGFTLDASVRAEIARRVNRFRAAISGLGTVVGVVIAASVFRPAWIIAAVAAAVAVHALATRKQPRIASALALDILLGFLSLELVGAPVAAMSIGYVTYGVIAVLLCRPAARAALGVLASTLLIGAALGDLPVSQPPSLWGQAIGWIAAAILLAFLLAIVAVTIDVLQGLVGEADRANQGLRASERHRNELIATVSHETRTPLTAVLGFATMLRDSWEDLNESDGKEMARLIAVESRRLSLIIDDLLTVARSDADLPTVHLEPVRLHAEIGAFFEECTEIHDPIDVVGEDVEVQADPSRFRQVLRHLLRNAVIHGGGRKWVETEPGPGVGFVRVCDEGDGIPEERRGDVFVPYVRLHDKVTRTESFGLGLTVARRLADAMGGSLTYRRAAGTSVFELALRRTGSSERSTSPAAPSAAEPASVARGPSERILGTAPII